MSASIVLDKKVTTLQELTFIGRDPTCDIVLEEESVNRYHALIVRRSDDFLLMDFKSVNGTFINGIQVTERSLRDRDSIQIGSRLLVFHQERREPVETGQRGLHVLTILAELVGPILASGREQMGYKQTSALFRPVGAQGWWLLAGDSPTLGPEKQGFLDTWASEQGVFQSPALTLSPADTLEPNGGEKVWFFGLAVRVPPGANLLVLFERYDDPGESLPAHLAYLEQGLTDLTRELTGFEPPAVRDLPPPPSGLMQRGTLVARLVMTIGRTLDLYTSTIYRIGRDPAQCDLVVDDDQVSRQHALLIIDTKGQATLLDFKSVNGILVGGKPMLRAHLKEGDRVDIGSQQLRYESVASPSPTRSASVEEVEPSIGIRVRQADLDAVRNLFATKEESGDIFTTLLDLVIEQFDTAQVAIVRLPLDGGGVSENSAQLEVVFSKEGVPVPTIPLRSGLGARAVEHVLAQRDGFFVRDYNVSQMPRTEPGEPYVLLEGVGSFFMTPVRGDDAGLVVLLGTTRENERLLGRSDWGGIQALVQAAAERLKPRN